jgi:hypothetical protein
MSATTFKRTIRAATAVRARGHSTDSASGCPSNLGTSVDVTEVRKTAFQLAPVRPAVAGFALPPMLWPNRPTRVRLKQPNNHPQVDPARTWQ